MGLIQKALKGISSALEKRHQIKFQSLHEVEHGGIKYAVAKTNRGKLVLFPFAKKVTVHDVIAMMNRENTKGNREMEWRGSVLHNLPRGHKNTFRVSGPFEICSNDRRGPIVVMRRVRDVREVGNYPLGEAAHLQVAHNAGYRVELPIAVFLGKGRFPHMLFTTRLHLRTEEPTALLDIPKPYGFTDAIFTGRSRRSAVFVDAEHPTEEAYNLAVQLFRKISKI